MTGSRFRQIADDLRERIALGDLGGSGALDSEARLGERYGASRITVRKALELLRHDGLVDSRQGSGWFATGSSFHQQLALGSFRHARSAIADAGGRTERQVLAFRWQPSPAAVAAALDLGDPEADVLFARSLRTVDGHPLDLAVEWIPGAFASRISRADAADPGLWRSLHREGLGISTVRQTITAGATTEDDAGPLGVTSGVPLLLIRRLALDPEGRPIALADHRYLAHRFSLEVEFSGWSAGSEDPPGLRDSVG